MSCALVIVVQTCALPISKTADPGAHEGEGVTGVALAFLRTRIGSLGLLVADTGDTMRNVIDHIEPGNLLLLQEIHRMRVLFAKNRHQYIGAGHFLLARRLHVIEDRKSTRLNSSH